MKIQGMPNKALEKYLALARQNSQGKRSISMKVIYRRGFLKKPLTIEIPDDRAVEFQKMASGHIDGGRLVSTSREIIQFLADLLTISPAGRLPVGFRGIRSSALAFAAG